MLVIGLVAGVALAVLATFKPSAGGFEWRSAATYTSTSRIFVTQPGFPVGRSTLPGTDPNDPVAPNKPSFAPSERFSELAVVYSYLAQSERVQKLISPVPIQQQVTVATLSDPTTGDLLPLLDVITTANSPVGAQSLNREVIEALRRYISTNVQANQVPAEQRVELQVINPAKPGFLVSGLLEDATRSRLHACACGHSRRDLRAGEPLPVRDQLPIGRRSRAD